MHLKPSTLYTLAALLTACVSAPPPSPPATAPTEQAAQGCDKHSAPCGDEETSKLPLVSEYLQVFPKLIGEQVGARYGAPQEITKEQALELAQTRALDALEIIIERLNQDNVTPYLVAPEPEQSAAKWMLLLMAQDERQRVKHAETFAYPLAHETLKAP